MRQLYTKWGKNLDTDNVLQEYPRPVLVRSSFISLNGEWEYAFTKDFRKPLSYDGKIIVPFSPESLLSNVGRQLMPDEYLWYRKYFTPDNAYLPKTGRRLILHFGAVDQSCIVYINGRKAAVHSGGYLPFKTDISSYIREGRNELIVAVRDLSDTSYHSRGKQRLKRGGMFYTAQSGIWQSVWMETVPASYIEHIETIPDPENKALTVRVTANGITDTSRPDLVVEVYNASLYTDQAFSAGGDSPGPETDVIATQTGKAGCGIVLHIPEPVLWTCDTPYLYYFTVRMGEDAVQSYFAMRTFSIKKDATGIPRFCLNGTPLFLNGVLDQGYWPDGLYTAPSDQAVIFDLIKMKQAGFNMVRKHVKIEPQRWYYHCDRLGLIVWQDMVNGGGGYKYWLVTYLATILSSWRNVHIKDSHTRLLARSSKAGQSEFIKEMKETVRLLKGHPSIAVWVIFNEGWGQFRTKELTQIVKKEDPHRLIDSASGWFDQQCGDFKSVHNYFFPFKVKPEKERAFVLSEIGGYTYRENGHCSCDARYGYKDYKSRQTLNHDFRKLMRETKKLIPEGLCAAVYTQWTDIEDEINGVYTCDREIRKID